MVKKSQLIFFALVSLALIFEPIIPHDIKRIFLAISLSLKSGIVFVVPFLIFSLIYNSCSKLSDHASRIIIGSLLLICISNFISTYFGCFVGRLIHSAQFNVAPFLPNRTLEPLFRLEIAPWIDCKVALLGGIMLGVFLPRHWPDFAQKARLQSEKFSKLAMALLVKIIPAFIFGYILKLRYDGSISLLFSQYLIVFLAVLLSQLFFIFIYYLFANNLHIYRVKSCVRNMIPAAICAFTTMSSAATLPYSMEAIQRNVKNRDFVQSVLPLSVNIHLIGNNLAIPILAFALLKTYGLPLPTGWNCFFFVIASVITKFSVVAVPGGGMIVMLPILEKLFGFDSSMASLILSLHLLFNPLLTMTNVLGNGAFVQLLNRLLCRRSQEELRSDGGAQN